MMNDQRFEQEIRAAFDEAAPPLPPDQLLFAFEQQARRTHRRPRWLAHSTEPPMYYDSHLAVGSPQVRMVSIMAATLMLLLSLAAVGAGAYLILQERDIVVDASGAGDYVTISDALEASDDGSSILVMPGVYNEYLDITKNVSISGVGEPGEILVEYTHEGQDGDVWGYGARLEQVDAVIRNLAFRGPAIADGTSIVAEGGSLTLEDVIVHPGPNSFETSGDAVLHQVEFHGATRIGRESTATVTGSRLWCEIHPGNGTFENTAFLYEEAKCPELEPDCCAQADPSGFVPGIWIEAVSPTFTNSTFELEMEINGLPVSIEVDPPRPGARPLIEGSTFSGLETAITVLDSATAQIRDNVFTDNATAITVGKSNAIIEGNEVVGGETGFVLTAVKPELTGNTVEGVTGPAVAITGPAAPVLRDNTLCSEGRVLDIDDSATPDIDDSNEICDGSAEQMVVDASGDGDFATIREALEAAEDGNTILVMPGTYSGWLDVTKNVSITGVGERSDILIEYDHEGQPGEVWGYGVRLDQVDATISNLEIRGPSDGTAIRALGGTLALEDVAVHPGPFTLWTSGGGVLRNVVSYGLVLDGAAGLAVQDSELWCTVRVAGATDVTFERSAFLLDPDDCIEEPANAQGDLSIASGSRTASRDDSSFVLGDPVAFPLAVQVEASAPTFQGNTFGLPLLVHASLVEKAAIGPRYELAVYADPPGVGARPVVEGNAFRGLGTAITVFDSATPEIRGNEFTDNDTAVGVAKSNAAIEDNTVSSGGTGFLLTSAKPELTGNTVEGVTGPAVAITGSSAPILRENMLCADGDVLDVADTAAPDIDGSNEICG